MTVGNADDGDFLDRVMEIHRLLDKAWVDVVAPAQDQVLDAVDDEEIAVLVQIADIAGMEAAAQEGVDVVLGAIGVAGHDLGTGDADFPLFARGQE